MQDRFEKVLNNLRQSPSNTKLILNEVGAGMPIYNKMVSVPGVSSWMLLHAESNNDIEFTKKYNSIADGKRLVSQDVSYVLAYNTKKRVQTAFDISKYNVYSLSNTVQISTNDNCTSHGYFSVLNNKGFTHYHYTLPTGLTRCEQIDLIGLIGLEILDYHINGNEITNGFIDYTSEGLKKLIELNMLPNRLSTEMKFNTAFYVDTNNEVNRFNDIFRKLSDNQNLLIYKGSFNPVSPGHLHTMNIASNKNDVTDDNRYYCITLGHRLDKKISAQSMLDRIELLTSLGYQVIVDTMPYFDDIYFRCVKCLDYKGNKIIFPLGEDVLKRLYQDCVDNFTKLNMGLPNLNVNAQFENLFKQAIFYVFDREEKAIRYDVNNIIYYDGGYNYDITISSTKIRSLIDNYNTEKNTVNDTNLLNALTNIYKEYTQDNDTINHIINKLLSFTF